MKIIENIKVKFLAKKNSKASNSSRKILLKKQEEFQTVLIVSNTKNELFFKAAESIFKNAELNALYLREEKEDTSSQFRFAVHESDFNLTGKLKNDKLKKLCQTKFDLVVDLSNDSAFLNFFLVTIDSNLIIGKLGSPNEKLFDLLLEAGSNEDSFLTTISKQLNQLNYGH